MVANIGSMWTKQDTDVTDNANVQGTEIQYLALAEYRLERWATFVQASASTFSHIERTALKTPLSGGKHVSCVLQTRASTDSAGR